MDNQKNKGTDTYSVDTLSIPDIIEILAGVNN